MPMIDVYASEATFAHPHDLARDLAAAVMRWEQVPDILLFRKNAGVRGPRGPIRARPPAPRPRRVRLLPQGCLPSRQVPVLLCCSAER